MIKQTLAELVRIDSVSVRSNAEIVEYLERRCAASGFVTKRFRYDDEHGVEKINLLALVGAEFSGIPTIELALVGHTDTVPYDPNWSEATFDFERDIVRTEELDGGLINALDPNLKPFFDRGGKLLQYHGWSDPQISPGSSVSYYKSVLEKLGGADKVSSSYRLFMVPGMAHCGGGDGASTFDMITALETWVEQGRAPEQISASRTREGQVDRTRLLCPYPQVATYKGSGSTDEASSFVCKAP